MQHYDIDWLRHIDAGEDADNIHPMEDFLELRKDPDRHFVFMTHFGRAVVGTNLWKNKLTKMSIPTEKKLWTVSDEALAFILLENSWDRWLDTASKNKYLQPVPDKRVYDKRKRTNRSSVRTKYTTGGHHYKVGNTSERENSGRGWSEEGIERFNKFFDMVDKDRETRPEFFEDFLDKAKEVYLKKRHKDSELAMSQRVVPKHELFDSDEDDEGSVKEV